MTVTRPDADGRPVELLELGSEEDRDLPPWVRRLGLAVALLVVLGLLGVEGADRLAERRARLAAEDTIAVVPGEGGGGGEQGQVQLAVGLRNDGPLPVRLRDPRFVALGLPEVARGSVEIAPSVDPGEEAAVLIRFMASCPAAEPTGRVFAAVTVVADSGREQVVEVEVTSLPVLLAQACRVPTIAGDLTVAVSAATLVDGVLRIAVDLDSEVAGRLEAVESESFAVTVRSPLPVPLGPSRPVAVELDLDDVRCDEVQARGGSVAVRLTLIVRATLDRSGAGDGQGPRPDGRQPDADARAFGGAAAVPTDLAEGSGPQVDAVRRLAAALVRDSCR